MTEETALEGQVVTTDLEPDPKHMLTGKMMRRSKRGPIKAGNEEVIGDFQANSMADAMRMAMQIARLEKEDDPDPYGYVQEVEEVTGVEILPPRWKAAPHDTLWNSRIRGRARKAIVAKMFLQGYTTPEIAKTVEVSESTVYTDLTRISQEWRTSYIDDIEVLAGKDLARLEMLLTKLEGGINRGDTKSVMAAVEIIRQRSEILGYKQGVQIDIEQMVREVASANGFDPERAVSLAQKISISMR